MKVKEIITLLQGCNPDSEVFVAEPFGLQDKVVMVLENDCGKNTVSFVKNDDKEFFSSRMVNHGKIKQLNSEKKVRKVSIK